MLMPISLSCEDTLDYYTMTTSVSPKGLATIVPYAIKHLSKTPHDL